MNDTKKECEYLMDITTDIISFHDKDRKFTKVSNSVFKVLGYRAEELIGKDPYSFIHPDDIEKMAKKLHTTNKDSEMIYEYRMRNKKGEYIWVESKINPIFNENREIISMVSITRDITKIRKMENEIKEQYILIRKIIDNAPAFIFAKDKEGKFLIANKTLSDYYGIPIEKIENFKIEDIYEKYNLNLEEAEEYLKSDIEVIETKIEKYIPLESFTTIKQDKRWLEVRKIPFEISGKVYSLGIAIDVTERKEKEEELKKAIEEAKKADKAKSLFLANMSHELRTPLGGVIGMLEILEITELDEKQMKFVKMGKNSAENLLEIVNDILDISRMEAGKVEINKTEIEIKSFFENLIEFLSINANKKGLELLLDFDKALPKQIMADEGKIRQILTNLIGNSIKFTDDGVINIKVKKEYIIDNKMGIEIKVKDSGIGIEKSKIDKIFEPFTQGDSSYNKRYKGTGLGLSISKKLVELMGGRIFINSEKGKGTEITFILPLEILNKNNEIEDISDELDKNIDEENAVMKNNKTKNDKMKLEEIKEEKIVLIVEDNVINAHLLEYLMKKINFKTITATNGKIAIEILEKMEKIDLILMDIQMPVMNGYEATKIIKNDSKLNKIPIIAVTAYAREEEIEKILEAGMELCITKPVGKEHLYKAIEKILGIKI
ncbi:PAS domain S-box protein [Haliovirga abyssi]|uniref:histidine kinase n=1 Tax=Haliovirga abyssi TaxID=2996794 RepID=A0AAU9DCE2_9FUSO|nr:PAS domain S-box protein [Haliovirga abyssi]BDU51156.1 hypothetical protein HLVA_17250 [Haliovirga abyssi]